MPAILINGSMCLTDIVELAKKGHSAFKRGDNGKVYMAFTQWINEEPDQYKNHASFKLNSTKEMKETEKAANNGKDYYIGNGRKAEMGAGEPVKAGSNEFDIPSEAIAQRAARVNASAQELVAPTDDLPF